jgi:hypothetical protein
MPPDVTVGSVRRAHRQDDLRNKGRPIGRRERLNFAAIRRVPSSTSSASTPGAAAGDSKG